MQVLIENPYEDYTISFTVINANTLVIYKYDKPDIHILDIKTRNIIIDLLGHTKNVNDVKMLNVNHCVSSSNDMTIKI